MISSGKVLFGINNIFTVSADSGVYECRIKGKKLATATQEYNPLCPGDFVRFEHHDEQSFTGLIIERIERRNAFIRYNSKKRAPQSIGANIDQIFCLTSPDNPPFRPRFLDRISVMANYSEIPMGIILNKVDLLSDQPYIMERLEFFKAHGIELFICSAKTGDGIANILKAITGKRALFIGQSGVGKSTLVNRLHPDIEQKTGDISHKYNRGRHTTIFSMLYELPEFEIIDSPGVREFHPFGIAKEELAACFPEFLECSDNCSFTSCTHIHEPGCAVIEAVEAGKIHEDRYEGYCNLFTEIEYLDKKFYGKTYT